jgi:predicted methyltransferase
MSCERVLMTLCVVSLFGALALAPASAQEHHKGHSPAEMNKRFEDPGLDVNQFVGRFEADSREIFARRQKIVQAVGLRPGQAVADVGAGTGLFSWLFAEKVRPGGTVYAVEIAPAFLKYIERQARKRGLENVVKAVRGTQTTTNLDPGSIDVAFVCATYHHFEHPGKVLASIHRALRPGGRLVVIDFDLRGDSSAFVREHARAPKEVYFREIEAAGFVLTGVNSSLGLKDDFFVAFERREAAADGQAGAGNGHAGWVADASRAEIPDRPAAGRLHGEPFALGRAVAQPYHAESGNVGDPPGTLDKVGGTTLTLQQRGKNPSELGTFTVFAAVKPGEMVDGKSFLLPPGGLFKQPGNIPDRLGKGFFYAVAGVQAASRGKDGKPRFDVTPKATMRLVFGTRRGKTLPGKIYLCLDDGDKSFVAGTFEAAIRD